jgi:glycerol-3-phosphate dehydrogenase
VDEHAVVTGHRPPAARLPARRFDVLVVGGGIIGAAIAAEAARAGLDVALVERGDFGGATSSASSKLVHGGLRYLRLGDVALVRQAHTERRRLTQVVAPHLVRRVPFLLPLYRGGPYGPVTIQAGLALYSALARSRLHPLASRRHARSLVPHLRMEGLRSCAIYADAVTHDGRLCLANVRAAADAGATVVNHAEVQALHTVRGRVTGADVACNDGSVVEVSARTVINATGPWVDELRRLEDPSARPTVRLSKGVHVLLELDDPWVAAVTIPQDAVMKLRRARSKRTNERSLRSSLKRPSPSNPRCYAVRRSDRPSQVFESCRSVTARLRPPGARRFSTAAGAEC